LPKIPPKPPFFCSEPGGKRSLGVFLGVTTGEGFTSSPLPLPKSGL
jgi:hypothetical protein